MNFEETTKIWLDNLVPIKFLSAQLTQISEEQFNGKALVTELEDGIAYEKKIQINFINEDYLWYYVVEIIETPIV